MGFKRSDQSTSCIEKKLMYVCQGWNISFPEKKGDNLVAIATVQDSCA